MYSICTHAGSSWGTFCGTDEAPVLQVGCDVGKMYARLFFSNPVYTIDALRTWMTASGVELLNAF